MNYVLRGINFTCACTFEHGSERELGIKICEQIHSYNNDKYWNTDCLTSCRTADSSVREIENRHHL